MASAGDKPEPRKRKTRKGTQSCWACKRRKVRCTFAASTDAVCDGCRRRGTRCIGQEFPQEDTDEHALADSGVQVQLLGDLRDRLGRVEKLVAQLVGEPDDEEAEELPEVCRDGQREVETETGTLARQDPQASTKLDELSCALLAAWPSQRDLDLILSAPVGASILLHEKRHTPYSTLLDNHVPSPKGMLQPPTPGSHPVLIARKLLVLGTFLQAVPSPEHLVDLSANHGDIMRHVVETAIRLVTSNDELVGSTIEGIECVMTEAMYHNNAGNLRRAYLATRRAMAIAQMMNLHCGRNSLPLKTLELETRTRVNPEHMWFRLVQSDRYLSLMLGLPQGSPENSFATPRALEDCTPMELMERIDCVAAGRILQRNDADVHNLAATQEIDDLLQKASASMPPQCRSDDADGSAVFKFLVHQRLSDRGMMERALESMEYMAGASGDVIASKIASSLRHLLAIEADAANGTSYSTNSSPGGGEDELNCHGEVSDGGNILRIFIPHYGTVRLERGGVLTGQSADPPANNKDLSFNVDGAQDAQQLDPCLTAGAYDWALQGVDLALFNSLVQGAAVPHETGPWTPWVESGWRSDGILTLCDDGIGVDGSQ